MNPQVLNFDLIADLDSAYLYVGTARMDLQVYWNEDRPVFFEIHFLMPLFYFRTTSISI